MTGPLVDADHRLARRARGEAEHPAGGRIEPGALEMDPLLRFDREIAFMGFLELLPGDADEAGVNVHEQGHPVILQPAGLAGPVRGARWRARSGPSSVVRPM